MEALTNHDCQFLYDHNTNSSNIIAGAVFEKFDFITMKQHLLSKVT
jgi:hypothetical protein